MKIVLCDINKAVCEAWEDIFGASGADVTILCCDFRDLLNDRNPYRYKKLFIATAGNSFGVMGGGLDLAIARTFSGVEGKVRRCIRQHYYGEMPVGHASLIPLEPQHVPFYGVYYTPTMRAPMSIEGTDNVYLATRAVLRNHEAWLKTTEFKDVILVLPGFGGQCGKIPPIVIARQMYLAYTLHGIVMPQTTKEMLDRQIEIRKACYE